MTLKNAQEGRKYRITGINIEDAELGSFLFSLGCYEGESVTLISRHRSTLIVAIKDGRYCIDLNLGEAISVK